MRVKAPLRRAKYLCAAFAMLLPIAAARAADTIVTLDPAQTKVDFTLGATLHTVHGTFRLTRGEIRFDPVTGKASGELVVDAKSATTANSGRDKNMHQDVLESEKYPEITFTPTDVKGGAQDTLALQKDGEVDVNGIFRLHGQDHDATLAITTKPQPGGTVEISTHFQVPYVKWGLKNPSTFVLRVSDTLTMEVHATATVR